MHDGLEQAALVKHHIVRDAHLQEGYQLSPLSVQALKTTCLQRQLFNTQIQVPSSKVTHQVTKFLQTPLCTRTGVTKQLSLNPWAGLKGKEERAAVVTLSYFFITWVCLCITFLIKIAPASPKKPFTLVRVIKNNLLLKFRCCQQTIMYNS